MRRTFGIILAACLLIAGLPLLSTAQDSGQPSENRKLQSNYKVEFTITETQDDKIVSTRNYSMLLRNGMSGQVRTGNKVPIPSENGIQYMDVGLRIDCRIQEAQERISLDVTYEIESFARGGEAGAASSPPVLRSINSSVHSLVQEGKPTVVSSLDDAISQNHYKLEVTVTKVQ